MLTSEKLIDKTKKKIKRKRYDLPLQRGSGGQMVTWIVGVMTFLLTLFVISSFGLHQVQNYWTQGIIGKMTIEIPYSETITKDSKLVSELIKKLHSLDTVKAKLIEYEEMQHLVGPWLGNEANLKELPLPLLIEITTDHDDANAITKDIENIIANTLPQAKLDTHQEWLADVVRLANTMRMILLIIALILTFTSALTVAATAKTRLALHREEVDLLHLIGATDSYIATQFQRQAFRLASEGASIGLVFALLVLTIIGWFKNSLSQGLLPSIQLGVTEWFIILSMPIMAGLIAMVASRLTVLRALKELP